MGFCLKFEGWIDCTALHYSLSTCRSWQDYSITAGGWRLCLQEQCLVCNFGSPSSRFLCGMSKIVSANHFLPSVVKWFPLCTSPRLPLWLCLSPFPAIVGSRSAYGPDALEPEPVCCSICSSTCHWLDNKQGPGATIIRWQRCRHTPRNVARKQVEQNDNQRI